MSSTVAMQTGRKEPKERTVGGKFQEQYNNLVLIHNKTY